MDSFRVFATFGSRKSVWTSPAGLIRCLVNAAGLAPIPASRGARRVRLLPSLLIFVLTVVLAAHSSAAETNVPVVLPFTFQRGHIMLPVRANDSLPLSFMLDTGYTMTMINPAHAETLQLRRIGQVTIVGIAGEEPAAVYSGASFDLGGLAYAPSRIAALASDEPGRGRKRDGILGHGFFRRFIIEMDCRAHTVSLRDPKSGPYAGAGEIVPLTFRNTTPIIEATVKTSGGALVKGKFEIDTGCNGGLCLGREFVERHQLNPSTNSVSSGVRSGVGGGARIQSGRVPQLQIGRQAVDRVETDFFLDGSPVDPGLAGHIGLAALRPFKIIFDYSRAQMILEPYSKP